MKRNHLIKGIVITSAMLCSVQMLTGCSTVQEVIDDYHPEDQMEIEVYGPMQEMEDKEESQKETTEEKAFDEESSKETADEEQADEEGQIEQNDMEEATEETEYIYTPEKDSKEIICVYGPPEFFD